MSIICPTVLAEDPHEFREQMERIAPFSKRIQIDLKDGHFASGACVSLAQVWWPDTVTADIHLMYSDPERYLPQLIAAKPNMVIVHAESNCDVPKFASELRSCGIKTGLAIMPETNVSDVAYLFPHVQHLLIFSGNLGHFGGLADMSLTQKITEAKRAHRYLEIGWDGGINAGNTSVLTQVGVDVLNVGGAIQKAEDPQKAFIELTDLAQQHS